MEHVGESLGCLRMTEKTKKERVTSVATRVALVNASENYTDPNSFWTNH